MNLDLEAKLSQFKANFRREVREAAQKLLTEEMPSITEELFGLYEKNGNRVLYERVYFTRRKFLAVFGLEAIAQRENLLPLRKTESSILEKLALIIEDICREECWALPPHVNRKEEGWRTTVDLFAAETAQALAELASRLSGKLPQYTIECIRENVERRVFLPYFTSGIPYRNWENGPHNWNGVCAGAIGSACIHLMKDDRQRLKDCLTRICGSLEYYLKGFAEDGACTEGLGYYTYGMAFFSNFAQELFDLTGGQYDLFNGEWGELSGGAEDKRRKIAGFERKCFFRDGRTLSFADGSSRGSFRAGFSCVLAMHYPNFIFPDFSSAAGLDSNGCYHFTDLKMDLLMPDRLKVLLKDSVAPEPMDVFSPLDVLPAAQWVVARSQAGPCMACKGGHNMEFHNHNDVGHFIYEGGGELFFTDLGAGEYRKGYFGEGRYEVLCNSSLGHSVPIVNGKPQPAGREYGCNGFDAEQRDGRVLVKMDLAEAYERGAVKSLRRTLEFDLVSGKLAVCDSVRMGSGQSMTENLVTQLCPVVEGERVLLSSGGMFCVLRLPEKAQARVREYSHSNHKGVMEKVYAIQWEAELTDGVGISRYDIELEGMK